MPELPEVETVRRSLGDEIVGRTIEDVRLHAFTGVLGHDAARTVGELIGRSILAVQRRGKYLTLPLDDATSIMVHLRMTGQLQIAQRVDPPLRFEHVALLLDDGRDLRFADQRKFGRVLHVKQEEIDALNRRLGPEPLSPEFTATRLQTALQRRSAKVKSAIMDQAMIAGLGNIYADEALFRARVHPERRASDLAEEEVVQLHRSIRAVLKESIERRGTTFSSFLDGYGVSGDNGPNLRVYGRGRHGDPCPDCGTRLSLLIVGGRSSHFCSSCQPIGD